MAISQGSSIIYTDLKSKYDSFNTFITNYGGSIGTLTVPSNSPAKVNATDINNLNTKITAFKNDTYLKTQTSWWVNATVTAGNPAKASDWTNINTTITNFAKVKCRNQGTNSNTYHSNTCTNGDCSQTCSQGTRNVACNPNGTHNNTCNNGSCSRTSGASLNSTGSNCYFTCSGLAGCTYGSTSYGSYTPSITWSANSVSCSLSSRTVNFKLTGCSLTTKAYSTTYMTFQTDTTSRCVNTSRGGASSGTWQYTINSCTYSTNSVACGTNGNRNHNCSNGANSVSCTNGKNSVSCNNVKKTNTTFIDITCTHASKNNG